MNELPASLSSLFCVMIFVFAVAILLLASAIKVVPENRRLSVYRLGRYIGDKGPGLVVLIPIIDRGVPAEGATTAGSGQVYHMTAGATGEARTWVEQSGTVVIDGVSWEATSAGSIEPGAKVRVKKAIVEVEKAE